MKCPYSKNLVCDTKYSCGELYRQMDAVLAEGIESIYLVGGSDRPCPVNPNFCARWIAAKAKETQR